MNAFSNISHRVSLASVVRDLDRPIDLATGNLLPPLPAFLTEQQVASLIGISSGTLRNWRVSGCGPVFCKVSKSAVRYPVQSLEVWLSARCRQSTSEVIR